MISEMIQFAFLSKLKPCTFRTKMYRVHSIRDISLIYPSAPCTICTRNFRMLIVVLNEQNKNSCSSQMYRGGLSIVVKLGYTIDSTSTTRIFVVKKRACATRPAQITTNIHSLHPSSKKQECGSGTARSGFLQKYPGFTQIVAKPCYCEGNIKSHNGSYNNM